MKITTKNNIIPLFGPKIRKEPFLIDTDTSIGEKRENLIKNNSPDILLKTTNDTNFGNTFNKLLPEIEPYLQSIYNNQFSKKRLEASIQVTNESINFIEDNNNNIQNQNTIENKIKNQLFLKLKK